MNATIATRRHPLKPLTKCIASALLLVGFAEPAFATVFTVTSCADSAVGNTTAGTLRAEVTLANAAATATSNDRVDLAACRNSTITLYSGAIPITAPSLTIGAQTGADGGVVIQGSNDRVFSHTGSGTVDFKYMTVKNGQTLSGGIALGGCIYSTGTVTVTGSTITDCVANASGNFASGGAIFAQTAITLRESVVSGSAAASFGASKGGGVATPGNLTLDYSTIHGNFALGRNGGEGFGGGVSGSGVISINNSTLDGNYAQTSGGAFAFSQVGGTRGSASITNSTISGNIAGIKGGASYIEGANLGIYNSTIAFNSAGAAGEGQFGGLYVYGFSALILQSSIFANNVDSSAVHDLFANYSRSVTVSSGSSDNLARTSNVQPGIIISTADPKLAPLQNHGGPTRTHALLPGSPAINQGNDGGSFTADQRGNGFARVVDGHADIGAYEHQTDDDEIFYNGMEPDTQAPVPPLIEWADRFGDSPR
jgi:hypothetical protein